MTFAILIAAFASIVAVKAIAAGTYGDAEGEPKSDCEDKNVLCQMEPSFLLDILCQIDTVKEQCPMRCNSCPEPVGPAPGTCTDWPSEPYTDATWGCTNTGDDWVYIISPPNNNDHCQSLCRSKSGPNGDGCCFNGDFKGCYWKGGATAKHGGVTPPDEYNPKSTGSAVTCSA